MRNVVILGMFDGMHMGHRKLISQAVSYANAHGFDPVVFTFSNHPLVFFGKAVSRLCTNEERDSIMYSLGVKLVYSVAFDETMRNMSAEEFVQHIVELFAPQHIFAGYNYTFGKAKSGGVQLLKLLCESKGVGVSVLQPVMFGEKSVSSTRIRRAIESGEIDNANAMLEREYSLFGPVVQSKRIGRKLGFPTANIEPVQGRIIPMDGVYATHVSICGEEHCGITNVGLNPTFGGTKRTIETYIIGFDRDVYGKIMKVAFAKRLRGVAKFESTAALKAQIEHDLCTAKQFFDKERER